MAVRGDIGVDITLVIGADTIPVIGVDIIPDIGVDTTLATTMVIGGHTGITMVIATIIAVIHAELTTVIRDIAAVHAAQVAAWVAVGGRCAPTATILSTMVVVAG